MDSPLNLNVAIEPISWVNVWPPLPCSLHDPVHVILGSSIPTTTLLAAAGRVEHAKASTRRNKRAALVAMTGRDTIENVVEASVGRVGVNILIMTGI
jgi:hypothetical protein